MPIVFVRIGWMRLYCGPVPGDERPVGGGLWNLTNVGGETFNFRPISDRLFGYFQPPVNPNQVNLERISEAAEPNSDRRHGVLVVMVATRPITGGQFIVGWYGNATIFRDKVRPLQGASDHSYYFTAEQANCVLLPEPCRNFEVPGGAGGLGQANIFYPLLADGTPRKAAWITHAEDYIAQNYIHNRLDSPKISAEEVSADALEMGLVQSQGQHFAHDAQERRALELHAMAIATHYF